MKDAAPGITILKRYGRLKNACWVLHHNGEAAVVEMPPYSKKEKPPWEKLAVYLKKNKLYLKYGLLTHPHWDHCHTLPQFRHRFPQTRFVTHSSFLEDTYFRFVLQNVRMRNYPSNGGRGSRFFDEIFDGVIWQGDLGGEPLYIIHAPKHSYGDQIILFRGAAITGDWYIGDLKDCNDLVRPWDKIRSIETLQSILHQLNYGVHMVFSGHGDHLFYEADFDTILEMSKVDHGKNQPNMPCRLAV